MMIFSITNRPRLLIFVIAALIALLSNLAFAHHRHHHHKHYQHHRIHYDAIEHREATILPHPRGCPSRAFCGCGAALEVFGKPIRELWLAANWLRFPRSNPAPGRVAVRRHHVFVLREHINGSIWRVVDFNSGGHLSRIHARSIVGYVIVNPHG